MLFSYRNLIVTILIGCSLRGAEVKSSDEEWVVNHGTTQHIFSLTEKYAAAVHKDEDCQYLSFFNLEKKQGMFNKLCDLSTVVHSLTFTEDDTDSEDAELGVNKTKTICCILQKKEQQEQEDSFQVKKATATYCLKHNFYGKGEDDFFVTLTMGNLVPFSSLILAQDYIVTETK